MKDPSAPDSASRLPASKDFYQVVQYLLSREQPLALLTLEIEEPDFVLRTFGPRKRNEVIDEAGRRIKRTAGEHNLAFHISQGRFSLTLINKSWDQTVAMATSLCDTFKQPFDIDGVSYQMVARIGISHYPRHAADVDELVRTSYFACHLARAGRQEIATYDQQLDVRERERFSLMVDLEKALLLHSGIEMVYQPVVELENGQCTGMEGLCRWRHAELGNIMPADFLPYVEQTSLMLPLTEATLSIGLEQHAKWQEGGFSGALAINLSPSVFKHPDLLQRLREHIRFAKVDPASVHFEITETGIMEEPEKSFEVLQAIREWGCRIALDDFGIGHSSLAYLADLPIDIIKIDKHFVQNVSESWGEAIVEASVVLARKLGLTTVAEGIETEEQYEKCRDLGVDLGQGFHFGRPMGRNEFGKWLTRNTGPAGLRNVPGPQGVRIPPPR